MVGRHLIKEGFRALIGATLAYVLVAQLLIGATASARHTADLAAGSAGLAALCVTHGSSDNPTEAPARHERGGTCCDWGCCPGGAALPGPEAVLSTLSGQALPIETPALSEVIADRSTSGRPQQPRAPPEA